MGRTHILDPDVVIHAWDASLPASLEIEPGDTVIFETPEITNGQITPATVASDLGALDFEPIHQFSGPIAFNGAEPGDALVVEIVDAPNWTVSARPPIAVFHAS
jgi:acetamidase/formamidase